MNNREAFERAVKGLDLADTAQGYAWVESGEGWSALSSDEIRQHIEEYLAYVFKQGPKPEDFPA